MTPFHTPRRASGCPLGTRCEQSPRGVSRETIVFQGFPRVFNNPPPYYDHY